MADAFADILDITRSLVTIMREESEQLLTVGRYAEHGVMTQAKTRLTAMLDAELMRLNRTEPGWLDKAESEDRDALTAAFAELKDVAAENAEVVARQLDLSRDLIAAVSHEAKRLTGRRGVAYRPTGAIKETISSAPISVNTAL